MHFNKPFQLFILFITSSKLLQSHQILLCALVFWNYNFIHDKKAIFVFVSINVKYYYLLWIEQVFNFFLATICNYYNSLISSFCYIITNDNMHMTVAIITAIFKCLNLWLYTHDCKPFFYNNHVCLRFFLAVNSSILEKRSDVLRQ